MKEPNYDPPFRAPLFVGVEITISQHDRFKAWLQLFGQEAPIRIGLDSETVWHGRMSVFISNSNANWKPKFNDLPVVPTIQFGKLVALRLENVTPPISTQNDIPSKSLVTTNVIFS